MVGPRIKTGSQLLVTKKGLQEIKMSALELDFNSSLSFPLKA